MQLFTIQVGLLTAVLLAAGFDPQVKSHAQEAAPLAEAAASLVSTENSTVRPASIEALDKSAALWVLPKEHHPWARFPAGSWREIEILTETFDENGHIFGQSVTTQRETLKSLAEDSYVLEIQATVDIAGKRITGPPNTRVLRLSTDRAGAVYSTVRRNDELLPLSVGSAECQVWEVGYSEESRNLVDRLHYSAQRFPNVLKREVVERSDLSPDQWLVHGSTTTTNLAVPFLWKGRVIECAEVNTVRRREKGESQTIALVSSEIPGGEVQNLTTDFEATGRRIRWSIQKLVDFEILPADGDPEPEAPISLFSRKPSQN